MGPSVTLDHDGVRLRAVVGDDGCGDAKPSASGLMGVARRLAAFAGTLSVSSPTGGPTVVTMEVPCVSSMRLVLAEDQALLRVGLTRIL